MLGGVRKYIRGLTRWQRSGVSALLCASVWTLFYFLFLRTPLPPGWTIRRAEYVCIAAGAAGGALCRLISRRLWPVALGAGAGIVLGGAEAYVSDTFISYWQRASGALVLAPLPLFLWMAILGGWTIASFAMTPRNSAPGAPNLFQNKYER
jgi:hypothetical protein